MKVRVSEARLNDLCYMALKKFFFEPAMNAAPREGDIRICMDMAVPEERIKSPLQAIILPNEKAGTSHDTFYEVDTDKVMDVCITYLEEHWRAEWPTEGLDKPLREKMLDFWNGEIVPVVMNIPEDECAVDIKGPMPS